MARRAHSYYSVQLHTDGVQYTLEWDKHTLISADGETPRYVVVSVADALQEVWEWIDSAPNGVITMQVGGESRSIRASTIAHVDVYDLDKWDIGDGS